MRTSMNRFLPFLAALVLGGCAHRVAPAPKEEAAPPPYESFTLTSAALGEPRRINVYTPPRYEPYRSHDYPVLYVLDGGAGEHFPHVAATVDSAIRAGEMRRMLVVGVESTDRRRDQAAPTRAAEDLRLAPRDGGSAAFRRFVGEELVREVRRRYRATGEAAVIGEALAGLFVVETFLVQPDLFDTYIALSPSLEWNQGDLVSRAGEALGEAEKYPAVVYLSSAGDDDGAPGTARLAEALRANAWRELHYRYQPRPDLTLATIYRATAPRVLRDLFPPSSWTVAVTSPPAQIAAMPHEPLTPLERGTQVTREPAGPFTLIREEYRSDVFVMHARNEWTRLHLSFDSPDRRVNVALTDDNLVLSASARSRGCTVLVRYLQYGYDDDERHLFGAMLASLRQLVEHCGGSMDDPARYARILEAAEADFPRAVRAMKARVAELFRGGLARCNPPEPFTMEMWDPCG
ncbi:MAG TPA: alpha/beta hydrolase-fold protein [Longimicrobium sp.]|nr:alpha/beta hydrolase-fold protein [Longimicrobium sp.]